MSEDTARRIAAELSARGASAEAPSSVVAWVAAFERGRAAFPSVALEPEAFARFVCAVADREGALAAHAADLFLAAACVDGLDSAVLAFERTCGGAIDGALRRFARGSRDEDELGQLVRVRVLVGDGEGSAAIAQYRGRGPLAGWSRVVATRIALNACRSEARRRESDESVPDLAATAEADPELRHLRARHAADFKAAFEAAIAGLSPEARNVLRFHFVDRLSIDQIGSAIGAHRVTAFRQLERARREIVEATRAHLRETLALGETELASVLRALDGEIELSLSRVFGDLSPSPPPPSRPR